MATSKGSATNIPALPGRGHFVSTDVDFKSMTDAIRHVCNVIDEETGWHKEDEDIEVDMSPMIDMVFLLLIFFIVASIIVDDKVPVDIPTAVYAKVPEDITGRFTISISKKEEI